jgi:hypothetical protein
MARFSPARAHFGDRPPDDEFEDDGRSLPMPIRVKLAARRTAGIREAKEAIANLPGPGESLHAVCTSRLDLTDILNAVLERVGVCEKMLIATLGYNERNLRMILQWLDTGRVRSLSLVTSIFFRSHKGSLFEETLTEFRERGQRCAAVHSHAKVVAMHFVSGATMAIEGSANLSANGSSREQFALINDPDLTRWHSAWIEDLLNCHAEAHASDD